MSNSKVKGELSATCKTFLKEWYANDKEEIHSKYIDKGNWCESETIDMMADVLGFGFASKNEKTLQDDYFVGTCDVDLPSTIVDVKSVWSKKSLDEKIIDGFDIEHEWQGHGYMHLYKKNKFILFYGLVDTPEEVNFGNAIEFNLPKEERWIAYEFDKNEDKIKEIIERVKQCRQWLYEYDKQIKSKIGKLIKY